jgi:hypothetical protein
VGSPGWDTTAARGAPRFVRSSCVQQPMRTSEGLDRLRLRPPRHEIGGDDGRSSDEFSPRERSLWL